MSKFFDNLLVTLRRCFLSKASRERAERFITIVAVVSFGIHLGLIAMNNLEIGPDLPASELLLNPIAAIYTPFSFILIYEVYLLIFFLPLSISQYIAKQYEIMTLIVVRRIFKDIANLDLTADWFRNEDDLQFTFDIITTLVLFVLIYVFHRLNSKRAQTETAPGAALKRFIKTKDWISVALVPLFTGLALFSFGTWLRDTFLVTPEAVRPARDLNGVFFNDFFTILILVDVLLLLFSFLHAQSFHKVIRNSGFIISTVMLKISFSATGLLNCALIISAVAFGVLVLFISNFYEKLPSEPKDASVC